MSTSPIKRGFACGDNASRYGRLGHAMGVSRRWTVEEARAAAQKAVALRAAASAIRSTRARAARPSGPPPHETPAPVAPPTAPRS